MLFFKQDCAWQEVSTEFYLAFIIIVAGLSTHNLMGEALERLCMELFMNNGNVLPNEVQMCYEDMPMSSEFLAEGDAVTTFKEKYEKFKADISNGKYGKTANFSAVYYMDVLPNIIQIHHEVQTHNFGLRLDGLKQALPFCFALNKQNYARYGTIFVHSLTNIETKHPGCKKLLINKGLSVSPQDVSRSTWETMY